MSKSVGIKWSEFEKTLNLTPEDEEEIRLEKELILAMCEARKERGFTQDELAKECGLNQQAVARVEKSIHSPQIKTIIKLLKPLGYKLSIVKDNDLPAGGIVNN